MISTKLLAKAAIFLLGTMTIFFLIKDELPEPLLRRSVERKAAAGVRDQSDLDDAQMKRRVSIDLGNGQCEWTDAVPAGKDKDIYGTLFASYPGSGMRVSWQHVEGVTGIQVGDDFMLGGNGAEDKTGLMKSQYPHLEGIWSWADKMDQVILLIRNPRWAIPSYHTFLWEIYYAHDWETAYLYYQRAYRSRPPLENWIKWRDYRFEAEIKLWMWYQDYYMEGGTQYWMDYDFERNGQWPFRFLNETERYDRGPDLHCVYHLDCVPKAIIRYDKLINYTTALGELTKVADLLRGKKGMDLMVGEEAIYCVYNETWRRARLPFNSNRDQFAPAASTYMFTTDQLETIVESLQIMIDKYSSVEWAANPLANELVEAFTEYHAEVSDELEIQKITDFPPTKAPTEAYHQSLVDWYSSLGRGNRYDKAKVQKLMSIWPKVKHLYESDD